VQIHVFLTSALVGGEWSASSPSCFTPGEVAHRYPLDRRVGGPQNRPGRRGEEKILDPTATQTRTLRSYRSLFFSNLDILGVESKLGSLGTAATPGLLYLPRVIVRKEKLVE
jgi:hypothetical protein